MSQKEIIREQTAKFRASLDPLWIRIRHLLIEQRLDPLSMVLAYFTAEDFKFRFGIFVDSEGKVFQFGFDFSARKSKDGVFSEWEDMTEKYHRSPYRQYIDTAFDIVEKEKKRLS